MTHLNLLKRHRGFVILAGFAAVLFLADIAVYKEFVRAESYFALGAKLMIERNEWLTPHAPDEFILNKPPVTYWLIGISYKMFGPGYGAARLPSVLAALAVLALVYAIGVWLRSPRAGLIAAAALVSSYLFFSFARMAMSDMLLTLWVMSALACFAAAVINPTDRSRWLPFPGFIFLAIGFLTKGPVALALVVLPLATELLWARDGEGLRRLRLPFGILLFLAIVTPYFVLVTFHSGTQPLRFFFVGENLQRFTGDIYGGSGRPFWYLLRAFFADFAPWSLLMLVAIPLDWRSPEDRAKRLLYLFVISTILLFSLSRFKLDYYLLPAMPAAALITGLLLARSDQLSTVPCFLVKGLLVILAILILVVAVVSLRAATILAVATPLRFLPMVAAAITTCVTLWFVFRRSTSGAAITLAGGIGVTVLTVQLILEPAFAAYLPATRLATAISADRVVYTSRSASDWANCLAFNLPPPHHVTRAGNEAGMNQLQTILVQDPDAVVVLTDSEYTALIEHGTPLRIIARAETYGHGGLNLKLLKDARREALLLVESSAR